MKYLLSAVLAIFIFCSTQPVMAKGSSYVSRWNVTTEYTDDSLSDTTKFESKIEWTLKGEYFTLFARYGNDWPFPYQEKDPKLMKRFVAFDLGDVDIKLGDFSIVLGRGILLSATEDMSLGRNSMLDGIKFDVNHGPWDGVLFYGIHKSDTVNDYPTGVNTFGDPDRLRGGSVGYDFGDIDVDLFYFDSYIADNFEEYNDAFMGFDIALNVLDWRFLYEHDFRDTYQGFDDGRAHYAEISGGWPGLAVTLQYKDYWNMEHSYNAPPRLRRGDLEEAAISPNDERGYMATLIYNPEWLGESYFTSIFAASEDTERLKPFHEFYLEYQHDLLKDTTFTLGFDYVKGNLQTYNYLPAKYRDFIFEVDHAMGGDALHLHLRYTNIDGELGDEEEKELGIDYSFADGLTLSLFYETSTKEFEPAPLGLDQISGESPGEWLALKAFYDIDRDTSMELLWGSQRGGYECSGGTCAQLPPFKGLQIILRRVF